MSEPTEGTQWYEQVWQTPEAKRKFEAGELGYREARKLDRELVANPKNLADGARAEPAKGPPDVPDRTAPRGPGPSPGDPGFPDPRDPPKGPGVWESIASGLDKVNPFATDGGKSALRDQRRGAPSPAQSAPEGLKADSVGGVTANGVPEYLARPAEAAPTPPASVPGTSKASRESTSTTNKAPDVSSFPEWKPALYAEAEVEFELPDGRVVSATPTQMTAILATEKAKEVNSLLEAYRKEDDAARSAGMWAEIVRGIAAVAIAQYGLKHGTNMSGFQLSPIDWTAQQRERRAGMESKVAAKSDAYKSYTDAAKEAKATQFDQYKANTEGEWRKFQANTAKYEAGVAAARTQFEQSMAGKELALKRAELDIKRQAAQVKDASMTPEQTLHYREMTDLLDKASAAEAKGEDQLASNYMAAAYSAATKLGVSGRPDLAGNPNDWTTPSEPGTLERLSAGIFGSQTAPTGRRPKSPTEYYTRAPVK